MTITRPADALAHIGAKPSADIILTKLHVYLRILCHNCFPITACWTYDVIQIGRQDHEDSRSTSSVKTAPIEACNQHWAMHVSEI